MVYSFAPEAVDPVAIPTKKTTQYFEMRGHRAIWADGWKAVSFHHPGTTLDEDVWELYHLDADFSECNDLAEAEPERLRRLLELFWIDAGRYGVLPIEEDRANLFAGHFTPGTPSARHLYTYYPPIDRIPPDGAPALGNRTWTMTFELHRTVGDAGALLSYGTINNGLVVYVDVDGHLVYDHNAFTNHTVIRSPGPLPSGTVEAVVRQIQDCDRHQTSHVSGRRVCGGPGGSACDSVIATQ